MKLTAFISYSHHDARLVERLQHDLQVLGIRVWRDVTDISPSQEIPAIVQKAIEGKADIFIVALTNNSSASPWVEWEKRRAEQAVASGWPLGIVYVKLDAKAYIPEEIRHKRFVDLSGTTKANYYKELLSFARYCIARQPFLRLGVYDIYESYKDMDERRENGEGEAGCTIEQFVECAQHEVIGVGYWFSNLFGPDSGRSLGNFLKKNSRTRVALYAPDPDASPLQHLINIHETRGAVVQRIHTFIEYFQSWGKTRKLSPDQAGRCVLHLMRIVPANSYLSIDPGKPNGRMIVHCFAVGIQPSREMKLELRYPQTPIYRMYYESLSMLRRDEYESKVLTTSWTNG